MRALPVSILLFTLAVGCAFADSKAELALQSQIASLQNQIAVASKARSSQLTTMQAQLSAAASDRAALTQVVGAALSKKNHAETMVGVAETNLKLEKVLALGDSIRQLVADGQATEAARRKRIEKRDNEAELARRLQVITASVGALQFVLIVLLLIGRRRA